MSVDQAKIANLFVIPLVKLGFKPAGDVVEIARFIASQLQATTDYQLTSAASEIATTRKYQTLPLPGECLDTIRRQPKMDPREMRSALARPASSTAPIYWQAEKFLDEYESATASQRQEMDRLYPGRAEASLAVLNAWKRPGVKGEDMSPDQRSSHIKEVLGRLAPHWRIET